MSYDIVQLVILGYKKTFLTGQLRVQHFSIRFVFSTLYEMSRNT